MPNPENLIPVTKETCRKLGSRGGFKAAETKRRRKKLKEAMQVLIDLPVTQRNMQTLAALGIEEEEMSNQMLIAVAMFQKAIKGDVRAAEYIRDITGQQPVTKLDAAKIKLIKAQTAQVMLETEIKRNGTNNSEEEDKVTIINDVGNEDE